MWTRVLTSFALGATLGLSRAAILNDVVELEKLEKDFDFIIVGGGTAGNVVANRLTENPNFSVLVLEAGGSNAGVLDIIVPAFCTVATPDTPQDWNYTTTPQPGLGGRSIAYPRGHVLGGSSSVNYMAYTRGSKDDFDRFARTTGDEGWSWNSLVPYMRKNERFTQPVDHHNITGQIDPSVHSFTGINSVSLSGSPTPIDARVIATTQELAREFPFNLDMNSGSPLGVGWSQMTILNGSRSSSATSYLAPQFANRPNLYVLLNAQVTRVLPSDQKNVDFRTVEFVQGSGGQRFSFTANKELIVSAGSIGSPSILMHSGIGNSTTLKSLGIAPLHNLPSVGQNLSDHSLLSLGWLVNSTDTFDTAARNATVAAEELAEWEATRLGPLGVNPITHIGWLRVPDNSSIFRRFKDPAAGPGAPQLELLFSNGFIGPTPGTGNFMGITSAVVSPSSRGSVTLSSSDPLAPPVINPNLLGTEVDVFFMRSAIRSAFRFASASAWDGYILAPPAGLSAASTDAELDAFISANAGTVFHPASSASASPVGAGWGVVDPDLRVKGLTGLRVIDLSVIPFIPAAHTQVPAYLIGERGADLIKEDWA